MTLANRIVVGVFGRAYVARQRRATLMILLVSATCAFGAEPVPPWTLGRTQPVWANAAPVRRIRVDYVEDISPMENGAALARATGDLQPGELLEIGPGRYSIARKFNIDLQGTVASPIWIVGADPENPPVITRPDAAQNLVNVGEREGAAYLCFRDLEFTGGSTLIRFYDCRHIWLDRCHLHHAGAEGLTTNSRDTSHFFITRNHLHHFTAQNATGEAMYLGANHGKAVMSYSVIAENHVHHCGGTQGDGIELKQGSHDNWIVRNHVHDTNYPCILVYGTDGHGVNVVEENTCYRSNDHVLQVQGEAIVRNNLVMAAAGAGLASTDHQGRSRQLTVIHNTIISQRRGVNLSSWNDREGMVLANNAIYTEGGDAIRFPNGARGVTVAGNMVWGRVQGVAAGFSLGRGLNDFQGVRWDATQRDAFPSAESPLVEAADGRHAVARDILGRNRGVRPTVGAFERSGLALRPE